MKAQILKWKYAIGAIVFIVAASFFVHRYYTDVECPDGWDPDYSGERVTGCSFPDVTFDEFDW